MSRNILNIFLMALVFLDANYLEPKTFLRILNNLELRPLHDFTQRPDLMFVFHHYSP